ncbi:MAG: hypothetical protein AABP62_09570 [Planctomycetota bacterium]
MHRSWIVAALLLVAVSPSLFAQSFLPGFEETAQFDEQVRWTRLKCGVRVHVNAPANWKTSRRMLVLYATPNGSTIEQTLGCAASKELDWRFDIQHVAAQIRRLREIATEHDVVLAVVQAPQLSWPTFRREQPGAGDIIRELVESLTKEFAADRVVLSCHSGGGSFVFGYLNSVESLPETLERIVFLDANYSYSDDERHGDKLLAWLQGDAARRLVVVAYDDREITLNGKKVVGPDGGTFRASQRMLNRFRRDVELTENEHGPFRHTRGLEGRIEFFIHPNPENKILHTALVGEMNGLLHSLTLGTDQEQKGGRFDGPRSYTNWIQLQPSVERTTPRATIPTDVPEMCLALPARPADAPTGSTFQEQIATLQRKEREAAILREITRGNVPEFLRRLKPIRVEVTDDTGIEHLGTYFVMCDYLAVGTDEDFFRVPITPQTATAIADAIDGSLITTKISDDMFAAAELKLDPKPLTKDRDAAATFWQHHRIIEEQLLGKPRGSLVAGIKKDIVLSNRLREKPHKVAIYGWHHPDGRPIQSLYVGHVDWYVDYSHGVRLMSGQMLVDGHALKVADVLKDSRLHSLLSDEGPLDTADIRRAADWQP